jgi:prolyl 4-hydroxylase
MVSVEDQGLRGGGGALKTKLWEEARSTIEEWTGMELVPTSMYGIRVYTEGAILSPHVDRMPLISSAIVNVAQGMCHGSPLAALHLYECTCMKIFVVSSSSRLFPFTL